MPLRFAASSGDRTIVIGAGGLLIVVTALSALLSGPTPESDSGIPSTYSATSSGAKAAFLLLKEMGYPVERWERPLTALPEDEDAAETTLVLAEPFIRATRDERQAVRAFLKSGGRIIATGAAGAALVPESHVGAVHGWTPDWKSYRAMLPGPLTRGAPEIVMAPRLRWMTESAAAHHLAVYGAEPRPLSAAAGRGSDVVVVTYRVGEGQVIWWAAPTPLANAGLRREGNLAFFLNSIGPPGVRVLWDEYHHSRHGSLWAYFAPTPVAWAFAQAGLLAVLVLATFARRHGPIRPLAIPSRLSPLEFVETLGDLYHRARAASAAVEIAYQRFRFLLARRLGVPPAAPASACTEAAARRLLFKDPGFAAALQRCERAMRDPSLRDAQALDCIQALHDYTRIFRMNP